MELWPAVCARTKYGAKYGTETFAQALARLRLSYFAHFPYLYKGTEAEELAHSVPFFTCPRAYVTLLLEDTPHGEHIAGIATHQPLADAWDGLHEPFLRNGLDINAFYYYSEGIVEHAHQQKGIGRLFQHSVEESARTLHILKLTAMTVYREDAHPLRPRNYVSFSEYMKKFQYRRMSEMDIEITWPTMPHGAEEGHVLHFWEKDVAMI